MMLLSYKQTTTSALSLAVLLTLAPITRAQTAIPSPSSYGSEYPDPLHILELVQDGRFNSSASGTIDSSWTGFSDAERSVLSWSDRYQARGPFGELPFGTIEEICTINIHNVLFPAFSPAVTNKTVVPPSGDLHDYLSWAP
jgi:hypothetical protein